MTEAPSSQGAARRILGIFARNHCRAGDMLPVQNLLKDFHAPPWRIADLSAGLDYAEQHSWIRQTLYGYAMTDLGLAEANISK